MLGDIIAIHRFEHREDTGVLKREVVSRRCAPAHGQPSAVEVLMRSVRKTRSGKHPWKMPRTLATPRRRRSAAVGAFMQ